MTSRQIECGILLSVENWKKDHPITSLRFRNDVRETVNRFHLLSMTERQGTTPSGRQQSLWCPDQISTSWVRTVCMRELASLLNNMYPHSNVDHNGHVPDCCNKVAGAESSLWSDSCGCRDTVATHARLRTRNTKIHTHTHTHTPKIYKFLQKKI